VQTKSEGVGGSKVEKVNTRDEKRNGHFRKKRVNFVRAHCKKEKKIKRKSRQTIEPELVDITKGVMGRADPGGSEKERLGTQNEKPAPKH